MIIGYGLGVLATGWWLISYELISSANWVACLFWALMWPVFWPLAIHNLITK